MARSISALGNPMLSIFWMAASRWEPRARAEGSLKLPASVVVGAAESIEPAGAGDGVAGAFVVVLEVCAGAAGGAGVCAVVDGVGVEGALAVDDEPAGVALGWTKCQSSSSDVGDAVESEPLNTCRL